MNSRIKEAFDGIHAEEQLKENTLAFLQNKLLQEQQKSRRPRLRGLAVALACCLMLAGAGIFSYSSYFTEAMYVDIDINPSMELTVNRLGRVIGVYAYNADGEALLAQGTLIHKPYHDAVSMVTEFALQRGFLSEGGLVSVTLQSDSDNAADMEMLQAGISSVTQGHHAAVQVDVFSVDKETREHAHEQNLSPAKYLAILDLQEVDPTVTMETCKGRSIREIRSMTKEHGSGHPEGGSDRRNQGGCGHHRNGHE